MRCILPAYAQRCGVIALVCLLGLAPFGTSLLSGPLLYMPVLGLAPGLASAVAAVLVNLAVYLVLEMDSR